MQRRLTILAVDAVVILGLVAVVMAMIRLDLSPSSAAETEVSDAQQVDFERRSLPPGRVAVSARVVAERANNLILPGDKVDVTRGGGGVPVLQSAEVLQIDPPLIEGDDRVLVTFSLTGEKAARLRSMRGETLLFVRLSDIGTSPARQGFEQPQSNEVITMRFERSHWSKRL